MNKGIVMELSENSIIVMSPDGRFEKLPRGTRNCEIGEEILFAPVKRRMKVPQMAIASALAAAIVMCFVLVSTLTGNVPGGQVVAYVTLDINPSVEIGIDNQEVVQDLRGLNTDGETLIQSLEFKGKSLEAVTSEILDKAEQGALAKGEADIIISSTVVEEKAAINDEAIATKLKEQVSKHIEQTHPDQVKNYEVTAFAAPQEVRQEAKASGVSAGKYAIYLNALNNGTKVSLDDIKSVSIHQLAKDNGGIDKLVAPDKPIDKTTLKKLVEDEKSGKLNEKFQQMQKEKSDDKNDKNNGKNNDKNNGKNSAKPTKTPPPRNDNNKNDNNDKNDTNGRNNDKDDDDDDRKPTKKPDNRDDKDDDDSKKNPSVKPLPSPSVKPTIKPTASVKPTPKPSIKPSPTPKSGAGSDSDSKGKGNDRDKDDDDKDRQGKDNDKDKDNKNNRDDDDRRN
ncbi:anti-sigma factor domain-containing protein [Paenibacillus sedimenti]|uniref:Anti-sigma factor domain-containing protein n=1 Tax=Paenibacillus sedimenti TaxID=2770274 RepID=A0A926KMJ9_9BACL|nr:anti-sigma factor domain-containing protein [Paenibacillus sedimenti]MBD0379878.1 anti-sigma factor domain-containing protein [Paenibacillus sedimenti]